MHLNVFTEKGKEVFDIFKNLEFIQDFYLAGGTGCALQIGHRISNDFDFFSNKSFDFPYLIKEIGRYGKVSGQNQKPDTLNLVFNDIKISFMLYEYPLIGDAVKFESINIASLIDIGSMKIVAIMQRGTKRDFVDLYEILNKLNLGLPALIKKFNTKYSDVDYNQMHLLKSLTFFKDADIEADLDMVKNLKWETVKDYFYNNTIDLAIK